MIPEKEILNFIDIFTNNNIELIIYGGSNIVLIRDKKFKPSSTNFIIDLNKCLNKVLPDCKGQLKNNSTFNKKILSELKKNNWILNRGNSTKFPLVNQGNLVLDFKFKNTKCNYFIIIWSYMSVNEKYYRGLRDSHIFDKRFFENPLFARDIYPNIPFKNKILMPNFHKDFLHLWYSDYSKKDTTENSKHYGFIIKALYNDKNFLEVTTTSKKNNPFLSIPKDYLNFKINN